MVPSAAIARELVIQCPDGSHRVLSLNREKVTLGRSGENDLSYPDDPGLSRRHLAFERQSGQWTVRDLGSKNGTQVNGARITQTHTLQPGDRVAAGHLTIEYCIEGAAPAPAPSQNVSFVDASTVATPAAAMVVTDLQGAIANTSSGGVQPAANPPGMKSMRALVRAGQELSSHRPLPELFQLILDLAIDAVGAARGLVMTLENGELVARAAQGDNFQISTTVRDRVVNDKASLLVVDTLYDADFRERRSIVDQRVRSLMAVPLQTRDEAIGLLYVDTVNILQPFTPEDLNLLTVMANVAAIRLEQARLVEIEQTERMLARDLAQAAEIQRRFLPEAPPEVAGYELAGHNIPCRTVGGDYYDFIPYGDGKLALLVGDVAGKGMPAALMMSNLQAHIQVLAELGGPVGSVMQRLNRAIAVRCPLNRFITFFIGVLDPATGELTYCNAGHNPPVLVRREGSIERLEGGGMVLGIFPGANYEHYTTMLEPGDLLALFSDGVSEAVSAEGEEFAEDHIGELLVQRRDAPIEKVLSDIMTELGEWTAGEPFADDVTLVLVRRSKVQP